MTNRPKREPPTDKQVLVFQTLVMERSVRAASAELGLAPRVTYRHLKAFLRRSETQARREAAGLR